MADAKVIARASLVAYLDHGRLALAALREGDADRAIRAMMWRRGAFERFKRHVDEMAPMETSESVWLETWALIAEVDQELTASIQETLRGLSREMNQVKSVRQVIGKYRSGQQKQAGFANTI